MSEHQTPDSVDGTTPVHEGQVPQAQDTVADDASVLPPSADTVHTQTHEALAEPVHVLPATRPDKPPPVQHPVAPPTRDDGMSFKEFSQMAGALAFVICFVALGLHAIYSAGY